MNKISKLIQSNPQYEGYNYIKIKTLEKNSIKYKTINDFIYIKFIDLYSNFEVEKIQSFKKIITKQAQLHNLSKKLNNKKLTFFNYLKATTKKNDDDYINNKIYISQELFLYFIMKYYSNEMFNYFQKENNIIDIKLNEKKRTSADSLLNTISSTESNNSVNKNRNYNNSKISDISDISGYSKISYDDNDGSFVSNNSYKTESRYSFNSDISEKIISLKNLNDKLINNKYYEYDELEKKYLNNEELNYCTESLDNYNQSYNDSLNDNESSLYDYNSLNDNESSLHEYNSLHDYDSYSNYDNNTDILNDKKLNKDDLIKLKIEKEKTEQLKIEYKILKVQEDREKLNINLNYKLECYKLNSELKKLKIEKKKNRWF